MPGYTTTPTYTPPSAAATGTSNMSASDVANWANLAYAWYRDRNPPKPNFEPVPMSPQEQQIYDIYIRSLMNPATQNNASQLNQMATQMLGSLNGMQWQSPRTFSGDVGYRGTTWNFTPPTSGPAGPGYGAPTSPDKASPYDPERKDPNGGDPGGYVNGGPFNSDYAPGGVGMGDPRDGQSASDFWSSLTRAAGQWNPNQETYEKWISRGVSLLAGAMGLPLPASLIDKGIDAAQWLYGRFRGNDSGPQGMAPLDDFYNNPDSGKYGSAYGTGQTPPGLNGTRPAGYGLLGGQNTGFGQFGAPGSMPQPSSTDGFRGGTNTTYRDAQGNDRTFYAPSFADSRSSYYNSQFFNNLQRSGGPAGPGSYGGTSPVRTTHPRSGFGPMGGQGRR